MSEFSWNSNCYQFQFSSYLRLSWKYIKPNSVSVNYISFLVFTILVHSESFILVRLISVVESWTIVCSDVNQQFWFKMCFCQLKFKIQWYVGLKEINRCLKNVHIISFVLSLKIVKFNRLSKCCITWKIWDHQN